MNKDNIFNTVSNLIDFSPIYIVAQSDGGVGPIHAFHTAMDVKEHLEDVDFYTEDVQVYYGSCIPASAIPDNKDNLEMYLIIENSELCGYVLGLECDCDDESNITDTISSIVGTVLEQDDDAPISMDNLFVLYGEELPIRLTVSEVDINDDLLEKCKKLKYKAEELATCMGGF